MRRSTLVLLVVAVASAGVAAWLFPRALPLVALEDRAPRDVVVARADSFLAAHALAPDSARRAVLFRLDDSLRTYVELAGGGKDTLDALLRGADVALYSWVVRAFTAGEVDEARVRLSADGRLIGFRRLLPDSLTRPDAGDEAARALADSVLRDWLQEPLDRWRLVTTSYETPTPSQRVDRTFRFERTDRTVGEAPIRTDIVIAGDLPVEARPHVLIPETFVRRYDEMRSANDLLALLASVGILALMAGAIVAVRRYAAAQAVRWHGPAVVGGIVGAFAGAAALNAFPLTWNFYDTATSPAVHVLIGVIGAVASAAVTMLLVGLTLAAGEALTRHAFPWHVDWWQYWRHRGTREIAGRVAGGYVTAVIGFAYIATFYLVTRTWFGWWVPSELLDDPNQIATRLPWVAGIAASLQAAIWEEALFRAVPLSMIAIWSSQREDRERWMALGVVITAILFGFAHSNYPSWPPYSRGIEIFLEACVWAVLFLRFGLLVPVLAHFFYDVVLFGLFATGGDAAAYRITAGVILLVLAAPGLAVLLARWRQGAWRPLPDDALMGAWVPPVRREGEAVPVPAVHVTTTPRMRQAALGCFAVAIAGTLVDRTDALVASRFTVTRTAVVATADSMLQARGEDPATWRRLTRTTIDTGGLWRALLQRENAESLAVALADAWAIPAWWTVRYVRTADSLAERATEWRVRVLPDGEPLDVRHIVPDEQAGPSLEPDAVRTLSREALRARGFRVETLTETQYEADDREQRRDVTVTYVDTSITLPAGATARARVSIAGDEVLAVTRGIEVPESFERTFRNGVTNRILAGGLLGMVLLGLIVWAVARTIRRFPPRLPPIPKPLARTLLLVVIVVAALEGLQSLPSQLAGYSTAEPWDRFLGSVAAMQFLGLIALLIFAALWMLLNGLRRRLAIPLSSPDARLTRWPDDLVIGLGLGAIIPLLGLGAEWMPADDTVAVSMTVLDTAIPVLARVPRVFLDVVSIVPMVAIPALAITGAASGRRGRIALVTVVLVLGGATLLVMQSMTSSPGPVAVGYAIAAALVVVLVLRNWGGLSMLTWVFAALTQTGIEELNQAFHAPTTVDQSAAALGLLTVIALMAVLLSWTRREAPEAPASA